MRITDYRFGRIAIDGTVYDRDVLIHPDGRVHHPWWRAEGHSLAVDDVADVLDAAPDDLVVGTGSAGRMAVPPETRARVEAHGIRLHAAPSEQAVRTFNDLTAEGSRRVAGAFHLTC